MRIFREVSCNQQRRRTLLPRFLAGRNSPQAALLGDFWGRGGGRGEQRERVYRANSQGADQRKGEALPSARCWWFFRWQIKARLCQTRSKSSGSFALYLNLFRSITRLSATEGNCYLGRLPLPAARREVVKTSARDISAEESMMRTAGGLIMFT